MSMKGSCTLRHGASIGLVFYVFYGTFRNGSSLSLKIITHCSSTNTLHHRDPYEICVAAQNYLSRISFGSHGNSSCENFPVSQQYSTNVPSQIFFNLSSLIRATLEETQKTDGKIVKKHLKIIILDVIGQNSEEILIRWILLSFVRISLAVKVFKNSCRKSFGPVF